MSRPPNVEERLTAKLQRAPTTEEIAAEVRRLGSVGAMLKALRRR